MTRTITITNRSNAPRPVYVEPEGADFWLLPKQTFEFRAQSKDDADEFSLWDHGDSLQIWPSLGMGDIVVFCDGIELQCGHQRPDP